MAYDFSGSGQYMTFTRSYSSVTAWSCAMWVNLDAREAYDGFLLSRSDGAQGLILGGSAPNFDLAYLWESTADEYNAASMLVPTTGTWTLLGMAVSSTATTLFHAERNGSVSSWTNTKTHNTHSPSAWNLGRDSFGTRLIDGRIAELGIWNATLTSGDFASMARGFCPAFIKPASLNVYVPLVRDLVDIREGVAITNTGPATVSTHCPIIWRNQTIIDPISVAAGGGTTRGMPFGSFGTAFNGGRVFKGIIR